MDRDLMRHLKHFAQTFALSVTTISNPTQPTHSASRCSFTKKETMLMPPKIPLAASAQGRQGRGARHWCAAALLAVLGTAPNAFAQQTAPAPAPAASAPDTQSIIVTANRRREEAQKVSGVVQSISSDQLRKDGITEIRSLQQSVPGLNIGNQEGNVEIYIRGVGSANNTELGDPGAAPHLNGTYIPRPRGLGLMFFDLERVEVNKGPQGTLYGRNALAGTLNIITAKPRLGQFGGYVQGELASRNGLGGEAALNIPLGQSMALRGAVTYVEKDAGYKNQTAAALAGGRFQPQNITPQLTAAAGLKPAGLEENYAVRLSYLWEVNDRLRITAMADGGKESGTGYPGANISEAARANGGTRAEDLDLRNVVYRGQQGRMTNYLSGVQAKVDYDLGNNITAEFSTSLRKVNFNQANASSESIDYPGRNYNAIQFDNFSNVFWQTRSKSFINEVRLFSEDSKARFNWSTGLFNFDEDQEAGFFSLADRGYCCYSGTEFTMPDVKGKSTAFFVDGTFKISDSLRALGGLRYTTEKKSRYGIGGNIALTLGGENLGVRPVERFQCCLGTRLGTEGYVPALLNRPNFDLSAFYGTDGRLINFNDPRNAALRQLAAQFIAQGVLAPGARDTLLTQIGPILSDGNSNGTCVERPDTNNGFVTCPPGGSHSFANLGIPEQQIGSSKFSYSDFRFGLEYDLSKDTMVYGKVSTGHKAGGFNDSFQATGSLIPETFKPEELVVLEGGMRHAFEFGGRRAIFNATGFYYDYKDQVFQDLTCISVNSTTGVCSGYSLVNRNIGASRVTGLELEAKLPLTAALKLDINASLLDTKITKGTLADFRAQDFDQPPEVNGETFGNGRTPFINVVGNELPLTSKVNLAARLQHVIPLGAGRFDWQVLANYRSSYFLTPFNELPVDFLRPGKTDLTAQQAGFPDRQKGFTTVNLGVGYELPGLRLEAFANNVTNEQVSQKALVGNNLNIRFLNDARTYGLRVRHTF
jgi:iron complex outermembrane recepter protein